MIFCGAHLYYILAIQNEAEKLHTVLTISPEKHPISDNAITESEKCAFKHTGHNISALIPVSL